MYGEIKKYLKDAEVSPRDVGEYKKLFELRKQVDPRIADIIDRWTATKAKTALAGNRSWYYNCFKKDSGADNKRNWEEVIYAFDDDVVNNVEAVSNGTFPYGGGREPGFLMIYDDNILEVCVYDSGVYSGSTNMEVMLNNDFTTDRVDTFVRKSLSNSGKVTAAELQKSILPVPEDTLTQKMKDIIMQEDPEQLELDLGDKVVNESDENWEFASADLMERIKRSTVRDLDKCATLSEMQTILQSKANTISSYLGTGNFKATDIVAGFERLGYGRTKDEYMEALNKISELENSGEIDKEDYDKYIKQLQALYNQRRG